MSRPALLALATGNPPHGHTQQEMHTRLAPYLGSHRAKAIFEAAAIDTRYSLLPTADFLADEPGTHARNQLYMQAGHALGLRVCQQALRQADLPAAALDHLIVVSCTGFDNPGLDVTLAESLGLRPDARRSALIGMGCHAGLTALDRAMLAGLARPGNHTLVLAIEFGTLHFQHGRQLDDMVAAALFGDGAAAAIIGPPNGSAPRLLGTHTHTAPHHRPQIGFYLTDRGYQIKLSTKVPKILRDLVPGLVRDFLQNNGLPQADLRFWAIHPGGAKILDYLAEALALPPESLAASRRVLRHYGNMSSPTIYFVLSDILTHTPPHPGDHALLMAFGPGLTVELALLQW